MSRLSRNFGSLNLLETSGLAQASTGIAFLGTNPLSFGCWSSYDCLPDEVLYIQTFLLADRSFLDSFTSSTVSFLWTNCWIDCMQLTVKLHIQWRWAGNVINSADGIHRESVRGEAESGLCVSPTAAIMSLSKIQRRLLSVENYYMALPLEWDLRCSGILCSVEWQFITYVSGQLIGPVFKGKDGTDLVVQKCP